MKKTVQQVIQEHAPEWLATDGVVGVYEGISADGDTVVCVAVAERSDALCRQFPARVDGYRVEIVETGPIGLL